MATRLNRSMLVGLLGALRGPAGRLCGRRRYFWSDRGNDGHAHRHGAGDREVNGRGYLDHDRHHDPRRATTTPSATGDIDRDRHHERDGDHDSDRDRYLDNHAIEHLDGLDHGHTTPTKTTTVTTTATATTTMTSGHHDQRGHRHVHPNQHHPFDL